MCPARDASDWDADVVEVGRTVLTVTAKRRDCYFKLYSLWCAINSLVAVALSPSVFKQSNVTS